MADTYTVTELVGEPNEWAPPDKPHEKTVYWTFRADGVDKLCNVGRKPDNPLKVGDSFEATVKEERPNLLKLKRVSSGGWGGGGGSKDYKADPAKLRGEAMRSAIHAAASYVASMAAVGRVPEDFKYQQMDPMIRHWYGLILEAQGDES